MRKSFVYLSENNNSYLYDAKYFFSMLIHPKLRDVYIKEKDLTDDSYYLKKYKYLVKHGFFGKSDPVDFETTLDPMLIKNNITNASQIVFETTDHCNLNCPYCSLGELYDFAKKDRKNINTQYAINLLKYVFKLKPEKTKLTISFFGGEPLMNFKFIKKIIEVAKQLNTIKKLELVFSMTTNATLIQKYIHFLVNNNFRLLISLDGDEEGQSYRVFKKNNKSSFEKVIESVDILQRDYPEYFLDRVEFNAVLHNRNSVKSIYEFIYNRYHKLASISPINSEDINPDKETLFNQMYNSKWKSEREYWERGSSLLSMTYNRFDLYRELRKFLKDYSINYYISNPLYLLYDKIDPVPTGTCFPFSRKIFLNTNNNILPCEKVSYKYYLGEVNDNVTIDVDDISRKYKSYYDKIKKACQSCYAGRSCSICMLTISNLDKSDKDEFVCYGFQDQKTFENRLNRVFSFLEKYPSSLFEIIDSQMIS